MSETDSEMRSAAPLRPPFTGGMPPRPMGAPPRPGGPPRPMPPPLRHVDSKGNVILVPGIRSGAPPTQMRPPNSTGAGIMSPPGQSGPRPQGAFPWPGSPGQPPANRPSNMYPGIHNVRPPFSRPPGAPGGQAPPPFRAKLQQPQQVQQQKIQQQQHQQQPQPSQAPILQRTPSAGSSQSNSNEDDDDVVMGQAVTPLKSFTIKSADPVTPDQASAVFGERTNLSKDVFDSTTASRGDKRSDTFSVVNSDEVTGNTSLAGASKSPENSGTHSDGTKGLTEVTNSLQKGDNDSGVDESTQEKERNGLASPSSPVKTPTSTTSTKAEKEKGISRPPSATPSSKSTKSRSTSRNRLLLKTPEPEPAKKVPMNKIQVGHAPSPNLKAVRSKIGSLENATYKPGGGHIKIETKKVEIKAAPRIEAKNEKYTPRGGDKKIVSTKLQWNAKSKIGSLENSNHKPGGGDKKIETIKTEFKDKAKPKVGSKDNVKYVPGGGDIKIQTQKLEIKAQSKVGSLDNVKHKPGGGEKKIFDDKDYLKNIEHSVALASPPSQSLQPASTTTSTSGADENLNQQQS